MPVAGADAYGSRTLHFHEVVRSRDVADRMQRAGADDLPLHALTRFTRLLNERLTE